VTNTPLPVANIRMETLLTWVTERVARFPREHKFTVGDRRLETCLDVQADLVEASFCRDKRLLLTAAHRALLRAGVRVRLAGTVRCLSPEQVLFFSRERDEIGRRVGGWLRSCDGRG